MRLYIIRHADPDYENNTITSKGHLEAKALAKRLANYNLTKIYNSPLGRAVHTMQYTSELTGIKSETQDWTQELAWLEVDTPYGNLVAWDIPGEIFLKEHNESLDMTKDNSYFPDKTEMDKAYSDVVKNSDQFIENFGYKRDGHIYKFDKHSEEQVAVFCHGGFGLTWYAHLLNIPYTVAWSSFWMPPSSVTTILFDERSDGQAVPRCIGFGDTSHLFANNLDIQPRGIIANLY